MPSPFPGMDPFLEAPAVFSGLHDRFITYLDEALQSLLPEPYYAEIGDRLWVEPTDRTIGPDVNIVKEAEGPARLDSAIDSTRATQVPSRVVVITVPHDEFREPFIQIHTSSDEGRVVTTIEILSLSNKTPGTHARELYLRQQREVLASQIHLVEIDLLRAGRHSTAVPLHPLHRAVAKTGAFDYHVCIHRFDNLEDFFVYPVRLADRLPKIAIPLLPGDNDVAIDLQSVFDRCYDAGPYRRRIRYSATQPMPPLRDDDQDWAARLLENWAHRPSS